MGEILGPGDGALLGDKLCSEVDTSGDFVGALGGSKVNTMGDLVGVLEGLIIVGLELEAVESIQFIVDVCVVRGKVA